MKLIKFDSTKALFSIVMKNLFAVLVLAAVVCSGCHSTYNIRLSNGDIITAKGKPRLDKQRNAWVYKDASGQLNGIPAGRVSEVSPQSIDEDSKKQFIPSGTK